MLRRHAMKVFLTRIRTGGLEKLDLLQLSSLFLESFGGWIHPPKIFEYKFLSWIFLSLTILQKAILNYNIGYDGPGHHLDKVATWNNSE